MESRRRSLLKALSWRLVALTITTVVAYVLFNDAKIAASVGLLDSLVKIVAYYAHERAWHRVSFGRRPVEQEQPSSATDGVPADVPADSSLSGL